tara:strand:- start:1822 stop:2025 length:204 start_codon:yes stop_codon:yes gene_type:complete
MDGMSNNQIKKRSAELFNRRRTERMAAQEVERIDRIENPDKYRSSKAALRQARMFMAVAAGFGVKSL